MSGPEALRLRMFAGPNGSGKTTLARRLGREFSPDGRFRLHSFVNADDLLARLVVELRVPFAEFGVTATEVEFREFLRRNARLSMHHPLHAAALDVDSTLTVMRAACDSYAAAVVADFLRERLLAARQSFSFETVMSHSSKVEFFAEARAAGYRTYLYFVATDSPSANVNRVRIRAGRGGHDVPTERIVERYDRCLALLADAIRPATRAFLFDNSGREPVLLAQRLDDEAWRIEAPERSWPRWFVRFVAIPFDLTTAPRFGL